MVPRPRDLQRRAPQLLLVVLLIGYAMFVLSQGSAHGRTYDEPLQDDYGQRVLDWYRSGGDDTEFLDYPEKSQMPQHGPFFETVVAVAQSSAGMVFDASPWPVRSLVCGVTGLLGVALIALAGRELRDWWTGFVAAAGLALYPRYSGAIFNNSKDIPLAVAMLAVTWLVLRLARRWAEPGRHRWVDCVLVGAALGAATSIRINALVWSAIIVLLAIAAVVRHDRTGGWRSAAVTACTGLAVIGATTYITILLTWPFILLNPVEGLPDAFATMSRYQWNHPILFDGSMTPAMELPRTYALQWLWLGSPWLTVVLGIAGAALVVLDTVQRRSEPAPWIVLAALVLPLAAVVGLHATLYNALRHVLFVVPPLILLGAWALVRLVRALVDFRSWAAGAVAAVVVAAQALVLVQVNRLYPYEYMYFNELSGGFSAQHDDYETDYWGVCTRAAMLWLDEHWRDFSPAGEATVRSRWVPYTVARPFANDGLRVVEPSQRSDFVIYSLMNWRQQPWPGYTVIHEVDVEGVPLCEVQVSRSLS